MKDELIKELWELWESMAECGELHIGPKFSANYKRLKKRVELTIGKRDAGRLTEEELTPIPDKNH